MLADELDWMHPVPAVPHTVAFGQARMVQARTPMIALDHAQYSVPHQLMGPQVWVRVHGQGPAPARGGAGTGAEARNAAEVQFLALGGGARM
jgi:hypothetical protein